MATATRKSRAAEELVRRAPGVGAPAAMEFRIFEDNGGAYHWTIVAGDGDRPADLSPRRDTAIDHSGAALRRSSRS